MEWCFLILMIFKVTFPYNLVNFSQLLFEREDTISLWFERDANRARSIDSRWVSFLLGIMKRNIHIQKIEILNEEYKTPTVWESRLDMQLYESLISMCTINKEYHTQIDWLLFCTRDDKETRLPDEIKLHMVKIIRRDVDERKNTIFVNVMAKAYDIISKRNII